MRNDSKGRDIFYGVVAVATLIVAIIGATLAYFSVTASSNEGAINATADRVSITYLDGQKVSAQADKLIPATFDIMKTVYETRFYGAEEGELTEEDFDGTNACVDSNGKQVCSAYRFSISSEGTPREITAVLANEHNGFTYLSYALYDVVNREWISLTADGKKYAGLNNCSNENDSTEDDCFSINPKVYGTTATQSLFGYTIDPGTGAAKIKSNSIGTETATYELIIFIEENNENQNVDQGQNYRGTIYVEVVGSNSTVSGYIDPNDDDFK